MAVRPVSAQTVVTLLVGLTAIGSFVISYQNSSRSEAIARSESNDAKLQCNLDTIRAEMRCKDACLEGRQATFERALRDPHEAKK